MTRTAAMLLLLTLAGCGLLPSAAPPAFPPSSAASDKGNDVVLYALGLIGTGYRYGGKNPEAGLDCSGMVSQVFRQAAGIDLPGSAAEIAEQGRPIELSQLRPGDLVFFNTRHRPHSHVGIYIGGGRFVHAPNSRGRVRIESLERGYFAAHLEDARRYFSSQPTSLAGAK
ncbi:MAG TPA: C40 family peptidase [Rhodocyclaceae bacterium]|nr:C40 family peptidase [Rhodocyclaceae bacterium]